MKLRVLGSILALLASLTAAHGMFLRPQLEQVPIGRVLTNLQQKLAQNPDDYETLYYLARVYSMAYATNAAVVPFDTRRAAPYFGDPGSDLSVPTPLTKPAAPAASDSARQNLTNAINYYQRAAAAAKQTNAARMLTMPIHTGLAWCIDQSGDRQ